MGQASLARNVAPYGRSAPAASEEVWLLVRRAQPEQAKGSGPAASAPAGVSAQERDQVMAAAGTAPALLPERRLLWAAATPAEVTG